jgi:hypothetical protein
MNSFTPFGYLQNPDYNCRSSYYDVTSGQLRTDLDVVGMGWIVPFSKRPGWLVSQGTGIVADGKPFIRRRDFAGHGLHAPVHTPFRFAYSVKIGSLELYADYWLEAEHTLAYRVHLRNAGSASTSVALVDIARAWRPDGEIEVSSGAPWSITFSRENDERYRCPDVRWEPRPNEGQGPGESAETKPARLVAPSLDELYRLIESGESEETKAGHTVGHQLWIGDVYRIELQPEKTQIVSGRLIVDGDSSYRSEKTRAYAPLGDESTSSAALEFMAKTPELTGDFPDFVKRGFHYDFETTRLCTKPPAGIFDGPWPTWMSSMPRVVLAEGSMDMARLAYADPELAKTAIATMLRDSPGKNVPCVFASGEFNMVAADGERCGTSPAWCIPFFYIFDVYLRTRDRDWVEEIYPHLVDVVEFWLAERRDPEGWLTYKCTWEAGEDNNPRIDPLRTGDSVISDFVRPVELQASMSHASRVLAHFAEILGLREDRDRFAKLRSEFHEKTQALWDSERSRFRDWDRNRDAFVAVSGEEDYWGADFSRQSPLSLVALLFDTATDEQQKTMRAELEGFFRSPFTIWPSWSSFVLEAASSVGIPELAGTMAYEIARRVYAVTDRRSVDEFKKWLPGAAPEYWPHNPADFLGSDAYAWGAQTASFLIRHVLGIRPNLDPGSERESDGLGLILQPALPDAVLATGVRFGVEKLSHRGTSLAVEYEGFSNGGTLRCRLSFADARALRLIDGSGEEIYDGRPAREHTLSIKNLRRYLAQ